MSERPPIPTTNSEQELFSVSEYEGVFTVGESPVDQQGYARPIFKLEGLDDSVIFVSPRKELPKFENTNIDEKGHVIAESGVFSIVEVTPAGLLEKAIEHSPDNPKLQEILVNIENQDYGDEELSLLDTIAAAVAIDESGELSSNTQTEGFALVIAGLAGNPKAKEILDKKLESYYKISKEMAEKETSETKADYQKLNPETEAGEIEPLKWSEIAFVHATSHGITRNENGQVTLRPYSHHNANSENAYPRATLHFTTNAEVTSHLFGQWKASNSLIITNGQNMVENNGSPARMQTIDTYWSVNPGQELMLGNASVVEPTQILSTLLEEDKDKKTVKYLDKESYTDEERVQIYNLYRGQLGDNYEPLKLSDLEDSDGLRGLIDKLKGEESATLRRIALGLAMKQQGIDSQPLRIDGWSTTSGTFDRSYRALAGKMGIPYGIHSQSPEELLESTGGNSYGYSEFSTINHLGKGKLEAERTVVAGGFIRPKIIDRRHRNKDKSIV